jgi:hypothetical protein
MSPSRMHRLSRGLLHFWVYGGTQSAVRSINEDHGRLVPILTTLSWRLFSLHPTHGSFRVVAFSRTLFT